MSVHLQEDTLEKPQTVNESCWICGGEVTSLSPFDDSARVIHCQNCQTESIRPLPTAEELDEYYSNYHATQTSEEQLHYLISLSTEALRFYMKKMDLSETALRQTRLMEI